MTVAQITVDDRFFEVAAAQSSNYPRLWTIAKETIQNSQDAGADTIRFDVDGSWVQVTDDGPGMAPTGGIANFLTIGSSVKNDNGSATGFFSTAKVRICFIHKDWQIWTNDEYLDKSMLGHEDIRKASPSVDGCSIKIQNREGDWDEEYIYDYVGLSNSTLSIIVNGKKVRRTYRRGSLKANFSWADVYVNRGEKAQLGTMVVRVNGLAMFTRSLPNVRAQVTVELDPEASRQVLTENREGLVWSADWEGETVYPSTQLNTFIDGLIVNPSSAKAKEKTVIEFVNGRLRSQTARQPRPYSENGTEEWKANQSSVEMTGTIPVDRYTMEQLFEKMCDGEVRAQDGGKVVRHENKINGVKFSWQDPDGSLLAWVPEEVVLEPTSETVELGSFGTGEIVNGIPVVPTNEFEEIFPYDYVIKHESRRPNPHTKHARILAAWHDMCKVVARVNHISDDWGVGLCVDQEAKAEWVETEFGDYLLIDYRQFQTTGSQLGQTMRMLRYACHELTHAKGYDYHNESFITEESRIYDTALENLSEVREATKGLTVYSRGYGK